MSNNRTTKLNNNVKFTLSCSIPSHNYALTASILLKTININAKTIKCWATLNSSAMNHCLATNAPATNILPTAMPIAACLPNGEHVCSTHTCTLDIPSLPPGARAAHIIPGLASHSLLSIMTMCNAGCTITSTKIGCTIMYHGKIIVCGHKCTQMGLWMIPLTPWSPAAPTALSAINLPSITMATNIDATSSAAKYPRHVHQLLCSPLAATLLHALATSTKLTTIPGLPSALIWSHLPCSMATDKGHMRCHRLHTALTCNNHADIALARANVFQMCPPHKACTVQDMFCFAALANATLGTVYTNITGAFPIWSFKNMQYIFVPYIYNLNAIIVQPMPSRTDYSFIAAFSKVFAILRDRGYQPALNVMDNKCFKAVEKHIRANKMNIQLVHCTTTTSMLRSMQSPHLKNILLPPLLLLTCFAPYSFRTNFYHKSNLHSTFNSSPITTRVTQTTKELYGPLDFNKMPLAPLRTKALVYNNLATRASWAPHATDGFYIGLANNHYRCLRFYIPSTRRFCFANMWQLYPAYCRFPVTSEQDKT